MNNSRPQDLQWDALPTEPESAVFCFAIPEANGLNEPEYVKYATQYQCTETFYGHHITQAQLLWYLNNMKRECMKTKLENRKRGLNESVK